MSRDRGSVIVADLALGAAIVVVLAAAASSAGRLVDAAQSSREAARSAAVELARGEDPAQALRRAERLAPEGATVAYEITDRVVRVRVAADVDLPHPITHSVGIPVTAGVDVPIAPYRSG
jgi:hypothetical protein